MSRLLTLALTLLVFGLLTLPSQTAAAQDQSTLSACRDFAFSREEDFVTRGPAPPDGNPIVSDGDLLGRNHAVCMRNAELVQQFDVRDDMGLDAVDVIDVEGNLVAFSTELDSPHGNFGHGDLLTTHGAAIPNQSLLYNLNLADIPGLDAGLDAVHFVGDPKSISGLLDEAARAGRDTYVDQPDFLLGQLRQWSVDIWFSIEGTLSDDKLRILDGDLLSARDGNILVSNANLLQSAVPAGLPNRGVDFGLDAATAPRPSDRKAIRFSTEILYRGRSTFTDGDILKLASGVDIADKTLYQPFEPKADFLGTDALYMKLEPVEKPPWYLFVPRLIKGLLEALS